MYERWWLGSAESFGSNRRWSPANQNVEKLQAGKSPNGAQIIIVLGLHTLAVLAQHHTIHFIFAKMYFLSQFLNNAIVARGT
jgi:hypothetical protein